MSNIAILSEASAAPAPRTKGVERKVKAISSTSALPSKKRASRPPLGKLLASNDVETRETAVEDLLDFLSGRDVNEAAGDDDNADGAALELDAEPEWDAAKLPKTYREDNMKVLWQGCYYCMYMCDKPGPQAKLAEQLAQPLLLILDNPKLKSKMARLQAALSYLSIFWITIVREWPSIDKHRTDKYYSLMRRMMHSTFKMLRAMGWDERAMQEVGNILTRQGGPLHLQDTRTPISIAYHVIDLFVEELERSLEAPVDVYAAADAVSGADAEEGSSEMPIPLADLLQPLIDVLARTSNKAAYQRVLDHILDPVLDDVQTSEADAQSKKRKAATTTDLSELSLQKTLAGQKEGLDRDILKRIFDAAARETTDDIARRRLYAYVGKRGYEGDE